MMNKVISIDRGENFYASGLTLHKIYEIDKELSDCYYLKNYYHKSFFISLAEWRQQQINSILDD